MRKYRDIDLIEEEYDVLKSLEHKLNTQFKIHDFSDDTEVNFAPNDC